MENEIVIDIVGTRNPVPCRLCASQERDGSLLFAPTGDGTDDENSPNLGTLINTYLPLEVKDDGKYPRIICPGCHIQLDATIQFFKLIIEGQKKLKEICENSPISILDPPHSENQKNIFQENGRLYASNHKLSFEIQQIDKPKRKRGRPKKSILTNSIDEPEPVIPVPSELIVEEADGKRKRCAPRRFAEQIQGKELEKIFRSANLTDDETDIENFINQIDLHQNKEIGHIEYPDGERTIVTKIIERKRSSPITHTCKICSLSFYSSKVYMAHFATHQSVPLEVIQPLELGPPVQMPEINEPPILESFDLLLDPTNTNLFPDSNINDPVTDLITSSILPIATMPPEEMNKKKEVPEPELSQPKSKTQCPECGKMFVSKQSCDIHVRTVHKGERRFKCYQCERAFGCSATLNKHILSHFPKSSRGFACDICGKVLRHPSSVLYHKESTHNNGHQFICKFCNKSFKHRQLLLRHQLVHTEDRPFSCKICNAAFKTKSNLLAHLKSHDNVKQFKCDICNKCFTKKNGLNTHQKIHTGIKPYKCNECGKAFFQSGNLTEHMRIHTGVKPYECAICKRKFAASSQYNLHVLVHQEENALQCQECGKQFHSRESFKNHAKRHKSEKPFVCHCGKSFIDRGTLRKHSRFHTGEKPYTCNICDKSFADNSNLIKHKKVHRTDPKTIINDAFENPVFCISYDESKDPPTIHVVDEAYENCINGAIESIPEVQNITTALFENYVDEDGNPVHFEEQITIASTDGEYLQLQNDEFNL